MRAVPPPHISITGLGYLGLPLAQKFYQHSSRVAAIKRSLTSDDINLPIHLDTFDLGSSDAFQTALWRHHADKPVWFFLLPPSSLTHYADTVKQWAELARACNVQHLIFTSSTSVYGDKARECDETALPDPQTESVRQILAAEQHLLDSGISNIDILRLGGLYCAERHPVSRLVQKQNILGGNRPINIVHRNIAVESLFQTAFNPGGRRLKNIIEPRHPTRREFYTEEAAKLGLPAPDFAPDDSVGKIIRTVCDNGLSL
ncbi:SDR family oxidoreductase [Neisseria meningitidis]|uniref:SDR family oxidoreductase n=1 Tax=Neisseria meningitidis TaxID=487 RepID=UPI000C34024F|nr:SDR family oxidoreductase [Neisseria meningitidis]ARC13491.2 SDR family NAD(P)-dependent oxidoreductase [Neisseria meningitidis]MBG8581920.1 SDR family oxidoreductase [Neisseria meningitidis]MBJ7810095.1 SDR family oxidoreductase [Neisseria meningitidis]MBW3862677.1 SDR family oxidoreductase [Neisseria meningitidis]MBW3868755.1 SDR family oxidoreductase [Neisseria meningitidis]